VVALVQKNVVTRRTTQPLFMIGLFDPDVACASDGRDATMRGMEQLCEADAQRCSDDKIVDIRLPWRCLIKDPNAANL